MKMQIVEKTDMKQGVITDMDIQALVDSQNAMSAAERRQALESIESDPILRKRYEELLNQKRLLQLWWQEAKSEMLQ